MDAINSASLAEACLAFASCEFAQFDSANLRKANLYSVDMKRTIMTNAILKKAICHKARFINTNLNGCYFTDADLREASFESSDMKSCKLNNADMRGAILKHVNMDGINLSNAKGLLDPCKYLADNFEKTEDGYIVYKVFGFFVDKPNYWQVEPGAVIEEAVDPNRTENCGCGINAATLDWIRLKTEGQIYKLLIRWEWLPGVVVPYNTEGKIRCSKAEIMGPVDRY